MTQSSKYIVLIHFKKGIRYTAYTQHWDSFLLKFNYIVCQVSYFRISDNNGEQIKSLKTLLNDAQKSIYLRSVDECCFLQPMKMTNFSYKCMHCCWCGNLNDWKWEEWGLGWIMLCMLYGWKWQKRDSNWKMLRKLVDFISITVNCAFQLKVLTSITLIIITHMKFFSTWHYI